MTPTNSPPLYRGRPARTEDRRSIDSHAAKPRSIACYRYYCSSIYCRRLPLALPHWPPCWLLLRQGWLWLTEKQPQFDMLADASACVVPSRTVASSQAPHCSSYRLSRRRCRRRPQRVPLWPSPPPSTAYTRARSGLTQSTHSPMHCALFTSEARALCVWYRRAFC